MSPRGAVIRVLRPFFAVAVALAIGGLSLFEVDLVSPETGESPTTHDAAGADIAESGAESGPAAPSTHSAGVSEARSGVGRGGAGGMNEGDGGEEVRLVE